MLFSASNATAASIVTNGGFETGDTTGWTTTGNSAATGYNYVYTGNPKSGTFDYRDGNYDYQGVAGLSQQLNTVAGMGYDVSLFWLATGNNDATGQLYQVLWNGTVIGQIAGATPSTTYTNLDYPVTAIGDDILAFQGYSNSGYNQTDDVSVTATGFAAAVPEPATWALMLGGFGMIGFAVRKSSSVKTNVTYA